MPAESFGSKTPGSQSQVSQLFESPTLALLPMIGQGCQDNSQGCDTCLVGRNDRLGIACLLAVNRSKPTFPVSIG